MGKKKNIGETILTYTISGNETEGESIKERIGYDNRITRIVDFF
jgi:hypothetical protein